MAPREIVGSRGKALLHLAICLVFVLLSTLLVTLPGEGWIGWSGLFVFGLCLLVFGWLVIRPQRLSLDARGFVLSGGLARSPRRVRWCDVTGFFVVRLPHGDRMIGYNYVDGARPDTVLGRVNHHIGVDAALPKPLPGRPERLVAELNDYRERALAEAGSSA